MKYQVILMQVILKDGNTKNSILSAVNALTQNVQALAGDIKEMQSKVDEKIQHWTTLLNNCKTAIAEAKMKIQQEENKAMMFNQGQMLPGFADNNVIQKKAYFNVSGTSVSVELV